MVYTTHSLRNSSILGLPIHKCESLETEYALELSDIFVTELKVKTKST